MSRSDLKPEDVKFHSIAGCEKSYANIQRRRQTRLFKDEIRSTPPGGYGWLLRLMLNLLHFLRRTNATDAGGTAPNQRVKFKALTSIDLYDFFYLKIAS